MRQKILSERRRAVLLSVILLTIGAVSCRQSTTVSKPVIENRIRSVLELPTVEYVYREIIYLGEEARFLGIKHMDKKLLFSIDFTVRAGLDLTKKFELKRNPDGGMTIILPEPEILLADADESSIHQFFVREWGERISRLDYYDQIEKSKKAVVENALARNILPKAKGNAEELILKIMSVYGIENIRFKWSSGNEI